MLPSRCKEPLQRIVMLWPSMERSRPIMDPALVGKAKARGPSGALEALCCSGFNAGGTISEGFGSGLRMNAMAVLPWTVGSEGSSTIPPSTCVPLNLLTAERILALLAEVTSTASLRRRLSDSPREAINSRMVPPGSWESGPAGALPACPIKQVSIQPSGTGLCNSSSKLWRIAFLITLNGGV